MKNIIFATAILFFVSCSGNGKTKEIDKEKTNQKPQPQKELVKITKSDLTGDLTHKTAVLNYSFTKFKFTKTVSFDRYSSSYFHHDAERGNIILTTTAKISSKEKNPLLSCVYLYSLGSDGYLHHEKTFDYKFSKWKDYGTYLGNYLDKGNDFAYTETIKFELYVDIDESFKDKPLVVLVGKESVLRENNTLSNPAVSYTCYKCSPNKVIDKTLLVKFKVLQTFNLD